LLGAEISNCEKVPEQTPPEYREAYELKKALTSPSSTTSSFQVKHTYLVSSLLFTMAGMYVPVRVPPPTRLHESSDIKPASASDFVRQYLKESETRAHLHPNAMFTPQGLQFPSHGGSQGGLTLHNLRRIEAGLRGEHLAPEPKVDELLQTEEVEDGSQGSVVKNKKKNKKANGTTEGRNSAEKVDDWLDQEVYMQMGDGVEVGEIGTRTNVVKDGGSIPEIQTTKGAEVGKKRKTKGENATTTDKDDKASRKKAKKEREKQMKREKEEGRKKASKQIDA